MDKSKIPVVGCYCSHFLEKDMLHIYRQVSELKGFIPVVFTQNLKNRDLFPFPKKKIEVFPKAFTRFFKKIYFKRIRNLPIQIYQYECRRILYGILRHEVKVLHIYFGHIAVQLLPLIRCSPVPVVVSFHGADAGVGLGDGLLAKNNRLALQEVFFHATLILVRSLSLKKALVALSCPSAKIRVQRTSIPFNEWKFVNRGDIFSVRRSERPWQIVQTCRLIAKKGLDDTIKAFFLFQKRYNNARLHIIGDGPMRSELERIVVDKDLSKHVIFHGFKRQDELRYMYKNFHLFFHPSKKLADNNQEGVPNSMLEAMGSGMPIIATRHAGIPEAVSHGEDGYLSDEGDFEDLAKNAIHAVSSFSLYEKLSKKARNNCWDNFELELQVEKLEGHYREAIAICGD